MGMACEVCGVNETRSTLGVCRKTPECAREYWNRRNHLDLVKTREKDARYRDNNREAVRERTREHVREWRARNPKDARPLA
jgi:hypothetical protein